MPKYRTFTPFPIHCVLLTLSFVAIQSKALTASLNKPQTNKSNKHVYDYCISIKRLIRRPMCNIILTNLLLYTLRSTLEI